MWAYVYASVLREFDRQYMSLWVDAPHSRREKLEENTEVKCRTVPVRGALRSWFETLISGLCFPIVRSGAVYI